jgi:hypothetical protein
MKVFVIVSPQGLEYIGMHESPDDAWRIHLGWPTAGEVKQRMREGWYCAEAEVSWRKPGGSTERDD